jgi:carboxylesterase type B
MNWGPLGIYDGSQLSARGGVCVVATNYRLGVLGFLVSKDQPGNQAILDQRMAMQWTQENIAKFGGNPNSVTLWGESAGAMSTAVHLVSPGSKGLFHRAIMDSNVASFQYQFKAGQRASFGKKFAALANCSSVDDMECLRKLDGQEVINYGEKAAGSNGVGLWDRILEGGHIEDAFAMQWAPVVDNNALSTTRVLPDQPLNLFSSGHWNKVPLILGTNQDEGATFIYAGVKTWLPEQLFPEAMSGIFNATLGPKVVDFYKPAAAAAPWRDTRDSLSFVLTDYWFKCSAMHIAGLAAEQGIDAYVYRFDHIVSFPQIFPRYNLPVVCETRTCHASELPFIFNNYANYSTLVSDDEKAMARDWGLYYTAFARSSDPNGHIQVGGKTGTEDDDILHWPKYNLSTRLNMRMGIPRLVESTKTGQVGPGTLPTNGVCDFFDTVVGYTH